MRPLLMLFSMATLTLGSTGCVWSAWEPWEDEHLTELVDGDGDGFDSTVDCDDADAGVNPDATEVVGDHLDQNCDDADDCFADADLDGVGGDVVVAGVDLTCENPGEAFVTGDCDDDDASVFPDAPEICDTIDNDCDALIDSADDNVTADFYLDLDGDGFGNPESAPVSFQSCTAQLGLSPFNNDCDDSDASVFPAAEETCNGIDDDCDGLADGDDDVIVGAPVWYADADGDGYGDKDDKLATCVKPAGYVSNKNDCDDTDAGARPGVPEVCDGIDNDCDGDTDDADDALTGADTWYVDGDADGYGRSEITAVACTAPAGFTALSGDCRDANADVNPGAEEVCNGLDDDCNGTVDGASAVGASTFWLDSDGDGAGGIGNPTIVACSAPSGFSDTQDDCADNDANTFPGATEICDGLDNDCDGTADEDAVAIDWYRDADGDTYGDPSDTAFTCSQPAGYVQRDGDCDDGAVTISPAAIEVCNDVDDDCDGDIDDADSGLVASTWFADADGDSYGDGEVTTVACSLPDGFASNNTDCDDTNDAVSPAADEVCNGTDDDCDSLADDADSGLTGAPRWYKDDDGDTYGDDSTEKRRCVAPAGHVSDDTDCDDSEAAVNPGADELCATPGVDDDCNGVANDAGASDASTFYADTDNDGYGDAGSTAPGCTAPSGHVSSDADCDDDSANTYPGAPEICDTVDNDCDGEVDEGALPADWYDDVDGDGYGDATGTPESSCTQPSGKVQGHTDCNDNNSSINPGADELCATAGVDDDCDGAADESTAVDVPTWYEDADGDGAGDPTSSSKACTRPSGYRGNSDDCDDSDASIEPSADEVCDGVDNDCDTDIDDADSGVTDRSTWYADDDGDGYGDAGSSALGCSSPGGHVSSSTDCDDDDADVNPGADEVCAGSVDEDCDGDIDDDDASVTDPVTWSLDTDGDGHGAASSGTTDACDAPSGFADDDDCNDEDDTIHPGATETCDGIDNDCNDLVDDDAVEQEWFLDTDDDGYGEAGGVPEMSCPPISGRVLNEADCDDGDAAIHPAATEICNGADDDCDGGTDNNAADATDWFIDSDGDSFGDSGTSVTACNAPSGWRSNDDDCNDANPAIKPSATEVCDGADNDCDGDIDDADSAVTGAPSWYPDGDDDTFGDDAASAVQKCIRPSGTVGNKTDCDDTDAAINTDADEVCDGSVDEDCDGDIDDADSGVTGTTDWFEDGDGDGYGASATGTVAACLAPPNHHADDDDCDDLASATFPGATEVCDSIDNDCDGDVDEGAATQLWYPDPDGDGYGDPADAGEESCAPIGGKVNNKTDCDEGNPEVNPGATEVCNGIDDDCDTLVDDADSSTEGEPTWYLDGDEDSYGAASSGTSDKCQQPTGYVSSNDDCDDADNAIHPGATESCNDEDDDCDGSIDEGIATSNWYTDGDSDGHGDAGDLSPVADCGPVSGRIDNNNDCDDGNADISPDDAEVCDDIDNDCDGDVDDESVAIALYGRKPAV